MYIVIFYDVCNYLMDSLSTCMVGNNCPTYVNFIILQPAFTIEHVEWVTWRPDRAVFVKHLLIKVITMSIFVHSVKIAAWKWNWLCTCIWYISGCYSDAKCINDSFFLFLIGVLPASIFGGLVVLVIICNFTWWISVI